MSMSNKPRSMPATARAQRGAVLVVALIFLILLTILAVSASGRSLLQERMAGGLLNAQQAEMSAQTALRGAEWKLWTSSVSITGGGLNCGSGIFTECYKYEPGSPIVNVVNFRTKQGWVTAGSTEYKGYDGTGYPELAENPHYIIEELGPELKPGISGMAHESGSTGLGGSGTGTEPPHYVYRITARATGGSANTVRVMESTFAAVKTGN